MQYVRSNDNADNGFLKPTVLLDVRNSFLIEICIWSFTEKKAFMLNIVEEEGGSSKSIPLQFWSILNSTKDLPGWSLAGNSQIRKSPGLN